MDIDKAWETLEFYDFAGFRLAVKESRLWRGEEVVPLTPKEFEVLFYLVERAGRVAEKTDLLDAIWADTFVEETTLARNVSWLRKKLAEYGDGEKLIETVPKRGYRFVGAVSSGGEQDKSLQIENQTATIFEDEDALIVEEEIVRHLTVEKTLTIDDADVQKWQDEESRQYAAPKVKFIAPSNDVAASPSPRILLLIVPLIIAFGLLSFGVYHFLFRSPDSAKVILPVKISAFSGLPGRENYPAFSPDSDQIVFSWNGDAGDQFDIYTKIIGAGEPLRLTDSPNDELYPAFSPDGKWIAFLKVTPTGDELVLLPALGGGERKICPLRSIRSGFSFAPDGKTIAVIDADDTDKQPAVFLVDLETGAKSRLTQPEESTFDYLPRFSPDGKSVAFIRTLHDVVAEVFVVPVGGGAARQITFDQAKLVDLAWNADGNSLVFVSTRATNQTNLWQISADGGDARLISTGGKNIRNLAISPDGKTIAFVETGEDENIWQIAPDRQPQKFIASTQADHSPNISPDAGKIVFVSDRSGKADIWIADANGKNQRQLTDTPGAAGSPRFSPDGKFVAFDMETADGGDIFVVSADGGVPRRLTGAAGREILPAWSADGEWIFFISNRTGDFQLWKKRAAGSGAEIQLTRQGAFESFAAPDNKWIYYSKWRGIAGLWRVSINGEDESAVPALATAGFWRYWTLMPRGIYFVEYAPSPPHRVKFYDFATAQIKEILTIDKTPSWNFSGLSATADGNFFLYTQTDQSSGNIMLAELPAPAE